MTEPKREQLGHYEQIRRIGEGGMGEVWEAFDPRIERRAAIKLLHPHLGRDPEFAARFLNEARAANRVQHPGVVNVYDFGQAPDGSLYIVMEYLDGETLQQRLRRPENGSGMDPAMVTQLARQVASALCAVHSKGIVHRDLKPANIILVADPDMPFGERVKLLDFGIAKLSGPSRGKVSTSTGVGLGTVHYMAPEQCVGASKVDGKADVYALGVLLYEALSGKLPIDAEDEASVMARQITVPPVPLQSVAPQVPAPLASLIMDMLLKHAEDRPGMSDVLDRLHLIEESQPPLRASRRRASRPPILSSPGEIAAVGGRTRTKSPGNYGAAVAFLAAVASTSLLVWLLLHRSHPQLQVPHPVSRAAIDAGTVLAPLPDMAAATQQAPDLLQRQSPPPAAAVAPRPRPVRNISEHPQPARPAPRNDKLFPKQPTKQHMEAEDVRSLD